MFDKYKYKNVSLRNTTHSKLLQVSKILAPGFEISIPNIIDRIVDDKISSFQGTKINGTTNDKTQKA